MKRILLGVLLVVVSCSKHENPVPATTSQATPPAAPATSTVPDAEDLAGVAAGAMIAKAPEAMESGASGDRLIDEDPRYGWTSPEGKPANQIAVIQLPERCAIEKVQFDTANSELDTHSPKTVRVEISDVSADDGFKPLTNVTLAAQKDGQVFPADANVPGRFIRLTFVDNYGAGVTQLGEFRAFGRKLTNTPLPNITGTYNSEYFGGNNVHLMQNGTSVTGCYEGALQPLAGGLEGHILKFQYETSADKGPALMAFSADGKRFFGGFWKISEVVEQTPLTVFEGTKVSDDPGTCPGKKADMESELADAKRLRLYGINFDSDSDHLRDESKPLLDQVAAILEKHADWKLTIEGHTDSTSTPEHNQQLSVARANAVKAYLVEKGADAARLATAGFGATKPVATNDTTLGRAANRRVELVRE